VDGGTVRYILRKFVDANTVLEAIAKEPTTPIHDVYLKEGEEPKSAAGGCSAVGFSAPTDDRWRSDEVLGSTQGAHRKKR
jgi:hypothetical protein